MTGFTWTWPEQDHRTSQATAVALQSGRWAVSGSRSIWPSRTQLAADRLAAMAGRRHAILTTSGSSAIVVALQALGIGAGDKVLVPATTWVSCATAVLRVGAIPILFDADQDSPTLAGAIPAHEQPDAILAIHLYAQSADVDTLRRRFPGVPLIEDGSHAHFGTDPRGRRVGSLGDVSIMSLQATKPLTCGEGGVLFVDDDDLAERVGSLVMDSRRIAAEPQPHAINQLVPAWLLHGSNHALSEVSAGLLLDQISRFESQCRRRAAAAKALIERLQHTGWHVAYTPSIIDSGSFYGLAMTHPRLNGLDSVVRRVHALTGLALDRVYPPIPEGDLYRPHTVASYRHLKAVHGQLPKSRMWHETFLVIPHRAFLAPLTQVLALAAALDVAIDLPADDSAETAETVVAPPQTAEARPRVEVVLATDGRRGTEADAVRSVVEQDVEADVLVSVWWDGQQQVSSGSFDIELPDTVEVRHFGLGLPGDLQPFERIAMLRQASVSMLEGSWVAFIDDDNAWDRDHLSTLLTAAADGFPAVHSWRRLETGDGEPAPVHRYPWLADGPDGDHRFAELVDAGVLEPGSPIVRESVRPADGVVGMVDMGAWLIRAELLSSIGFAPWRRSERELRERVGEDDLLLERLVELGVPTGCTGRATYAYRLGGMSNPESVAALAGGA